MSDDHILSHDEIANMDTEPIQPLPETLVHEWMAQAEAERETNAHLEGAAWFAATFDAPGRQLLMPLDDAVNYAVIVQSVDPWTTEVAVEKYWKEPGGHLGIDGLTVETFDSDDDARERAEAARLGLLETYDERGLEGMMHQAELAAMRNGWLDGERGDPRLFRHGPPDRFETLAERLRDEPNPYWNTEGDAIDPPPTPNGHYWQMHALPAATPDGQPLGVALHLIEFPQLPPDFDAYVEANGIDDTTYPTEARRLEVACFASPDDARKFEADFRAYLIPGVLDAPELAEEVARQNGLSAEWEQMSYREIVAVMGETKLCQADEDWKLHIR